MARLLGPGGTGVTSPGIYSNGGSSHGAAPDSWWDQLAQALESSGAGRVLRIILNRQGNGPDDSPSDAASFVEGGGVWIDWCAWPWYYQPGGDVVNAPGTGFSVFNAQGLGNRIIPLYHSSSFLGGLLNAGGIIPGASLLNRDIPFGWGGAPWAPLVDPRVYPYNRGLVTLTAPDTRGIVTQAPWFEVHYAAPTGIQQIYLYSTLRIPAGNGNGNYFYAAVSAGPFGGADPHSAVQPAAYIPFILGQLGFQPVAVSVPSTAAAPATTASAPRVLTGSPAAGLPSLVSCQSQVFSVADEGQSLPCVKTLQTRLNQLINAGLAVDGHYGPLTQAAVEEFQRQQGITVDGIVGPQTWGRLERPQSAPATTSTAAAAPVTTAPAPSTVSSTGLSSPASSPPPTTPLPSTSTPTVLGVPVGTLEVGAVIVGAGLLALALLNRS